jgi:ABC-2 type transport system permease protein
MDKILRVMRKEFSAFFASPIAFIFLGTFLAVTLFIFFWVETFFARNIADVRPLFEWMPVLLIFLVAAITMRMWSEERRAGTLEFLLTSPVRPIYFVLGKFLACLALVATALALTLPLPISVSFLGQFDWGPIIGGYIAALFLAAAYIAIGLFVSARSENQIVSLILTVVVCSLFYLLGSSPLTDLFGNRGAELLQLLGSGSRFESITRGVIDLRDLYYYLSLVGLFLALNVLTLEWLRWAGNARNTSHKQWGFLTGLLVANFLAANLWLAPMGWARADITEGNIYSISDATRGYLAQLREPLLIRGYFSAQTHPLLAPLVPQLRDLMKEYEIAGKGNVRVEIVDPADDPKLEQEAGEKYNIEPMPFQIASKYQAAVVSSYFDILVQYGDQYEILGFRDLIEYKASGAEMDIDVTLRNPEYDLTQAIKKVLYAYQAAGQLFSNIEQQVTLKAYISADQTLPEPLIDFKKSLLEIGDELKKEGGDKFQLEVVDPNAGGGELAQQLESDYGFRPMAAGLFSTQRFWFYMVLQSGDQLIQIPLAEDLNKASLEQGIEAGLKRFSKGFLKTIALHTPPGTPPMPQMGMPGDQKQFNNLREVMEQDHSVIDAPLDNGYVPEQADLLIVAAPENLNDKQVFGIDQFLMQGGTVILATAPYDISLQRGLMAQKHRSGLEDWLKHHGIHIEDRLVMDSRNTAFPVPVQRRLGAFTVQETRMVDYPYFVDIRENGMEQDSGLMTGLNQLTMTWASPITVDAQLNEQRQVIKLLHSSADSWTSDSINIQPDFNQDASGFQRGTAEGEKTLAVAVEGEFTSFFKDKESPLIVQAEAAGDNNKDDAQAADQGLITRVIAKSPQSARIIVLASNTELTDTSLNLLSSGMGTRYLNPVQLVANAVDWSLEDRGLLSIRGRTHYSRTLYPLNNQAQIFWEYLNYALALLGLVAVWVLQIIARRRKQLHYQTVLAQ